MTNNEFHAAVPVLASEDVKASVDYFVRVLGFEPDFSWGEPPAYAGVSAGDVEVYFAHDPATVAAIREKGLAPDVFFWVRDIDGLYARHQAAGAEIVEPLAERPWGARQYVVREPQGYRLKIAAPVR
jgi:uncharacterized glyoxalase superfamily protein PhnB